MSGIIIPGRARRNPRARIVRPGATPNPRARIIRPGAVPERTVRLTDARGNQIGRAIRQGRTEASRQQERDRGRRLRTRRTVGARVGASRAARRGSGFAAFSRAAGTRARRANAAQARRTRRPVGPLAGTALGR